MLFGNSNVILKNEIEDLKNQIKILDDVLSENIGNTKILTEAVKQLQQSLVELNKNFLKEKTHAEQTITELKNTISELKEKIKKKETCKIKNLFSKKEKK
jgi:DNA/RNA-binding domain of Phe-tRNA-synthetase-like protein